MVNGVVQRFLAPSSRSDGVLLHILLRVTGCPSTSLRVVSLSDHELRVNFSELQFRCQSATRNGLFPLLKSSSPPKLQFYLHKSRPKVQPFLE
jgi:hypothetical protein